MKKTTLTVISLLSVSCVGSGGLGVRGKSDRELKARFSQIERELASYSAGEQDQARLDYYRKLAQEEQTVEGELYRRCEAGDQDACLPRFRGIHE